MKAHVCVVVVDKSFGGKLTGNSDSTGSPIAALTMAGSTKYLILHFLHSIYHYVPCGTVKTLTPVC